MAKFNSKAKNTTFEGAPAQLKSLDQEWTNALCSSFLGDTFYETAETQTARYVKLTRDMAAARGPQFVAKAATFSRNVLGMRSVSALTAAILNEYQFDSKRDFYADYFHRPDDVAEVFGAVDTLGGKRSHALVRGAADYLNGLSDYSLGKYKLSNREYNMYDIINLTHAHSAAIEKYKTDTLPIPETWETVISAASPAEKGGKWVYLVENHKLGYMALLRNLCNIYDDTTESISWWREVVVPQLINKDAIKKSLVFPYRIYVAYKSLEDDMMLDEETMRLLKDALGMAFVSSASNALKFDGRNLIVVDVSGSMSTAISPNSSVSLREAGACYAAMLVMGTGSTDYIKFGSAAKRYSEEEFNETNIFDLIEKMAANDGLGYTTKLCNIWPLIKNEKYDRIFIISDMQVMDSHGHDKATWAFVSGNGPKSFDSYCEMTECNPCVYTFDLGQYHSQPAEFGDKVSYFTALSADTMKFISLLESGVSICDYIESGDWK